MDQALDTHVIPIRATPLRVLVRVVQPPRPCAALRARAHALVVHLAQVVRLFARPAPPGTQANTGERGDAT